jgi:peptide/nickel transport system substrate-binding protein
VALCVATITPSAAAGNQQKVDIRFRTMKGFESPGTPAQYNKVGVIEVGPSDAENILVLVPGTSASAAYFVPLAKDVVRKSKGWQVWAIERRENFLEDHSVLNQAKKGKATPKEIFDYYLGFVTDPSITKHFQFIRDDDVAYAREWGMRVEVEDMRRVIRSAKEKGGKVVLGAEQWPECINPITSCVGASWTYWSVMYHIMPTLNALDLDGNNTKGSIATEFPTAENGGVEDNGLKITVPLDPNAVWDDKSPITCDDVRFTWLAQLNTKGAYAAGVGYDQIEDIDCSDPQQVVMNFKKPYADWTDLFGGGLGFVIKAAAYKGLDPEKPDISKENADDIDYSGGPWILKSWSKQQAVFLPNKNYWIEDNIPLLDQMTEIPLLDQSAEINAVLSGEVAAIWPQPSEVSILDQVAGDPNVVAKGVTGFFNEEIWINHSHPPLDDPTVREALAYALDRDGVVNAIIKVNQPDAEVSTCVGNTYETIGDWCTPVFTDVSYDPKKAVQLLEGDGWDCSGVPNNPCTKDGQPLSLQYSTVAGNTRREATQQLLKEKARPAGFEFRVKNYDAGVLFGDVGPHGQFDIADYALGGTPDPSFTGNFGCESIPTQANSFAGANWVHWCNKQAYQLMQDSDAEIDITKRVDLIHQISEIYAQDFVSIPLYILPNVGVWRTDQVAGPIGEYNSHFYGLFYNSFDWYKP